MNDMPRRKRVSGVAAFAIVTVSTLLLGALAGFASAFLGDQPGVAGLGVTATLISVVIVLAFFAALWWWRQIDEAAREAHKWAWWWGGSGGMSIGMALLLTLMLGADSNQPLPASFGSAPGAIFVSGMMSILMFQLAGYGLAWAGWWLKHR